MSRKVILMLICMCICSVVMSNRLNDNLNNDEQLTIDSIKVHDVEIDMSNEDKEGAEYKGELGDDKNYNTNNDINWNQDIASINDLKSKGINVIITNTSNKEISSGVIKANN